MSNLSKKTIQLELSIKSCRVPEPNGTRVIIYWARGERQIDTRPGITNNGKALFKDKFAMKTILDYDYDTGAYISKASKLQLYKGENKKSMEYVGEAEFDLARYGRISQVIERLPLKSKLYEQNDSYPSYIEIGIKVTTIQDQPQSPTGVLSPEKNKYQRASTQEQKSSKFDFEQQDEQESQSQQKLSDGKLDEEDNLNLNINEINNQKMEELLEDGNATSLNRQLSLTQTEIDEEESKFEQMKEEFELKEIEYKSRISILRKDASTARAEIKKYKEQTLELKDRQIKNNQLYLNMDQNQRQKCLEKDKMIKQLKEKVELAKLQNKELKESLSSFKIKMVELKQVKELEEIQKQLKLLKIIKKEGEQLQQAKESAEQTLKYSYSIQSFSKITSKISESLQEASHSLKGKDEYLHTSPLESQITSDTNDNKYKYTSPFMEQFKNTDNEEPRKYSDDKNTPHKSHQQIYYNKRMLESISKSNEKGTFQNNPDYQDGYILFSNRNE